jgi:hypothetical protein
MNSIEKYIQNELDIVRYRVQMFKRIKNPSPAKRRLMERDLEFLEIPFFKLGFKSVDEAGEAISLYKNSRVEFHKVYGCFKIEELYGQFDNKLEFLLDRRDDFLSSRVEEVNLIQNTYFFNKLIKYESEHSHSPEEKIRQKLSGCSSKELLAMEPVTIGRERARVQAVIYAIGLYLAESLSKISLPEDSISDIFASIKELEDLVDKVKYSLFKHYNSALAVLPKKLNGTMGENPHIEKLSPLQNILDLYPSEAAPVFKPESFDLAKPQVGHLLFGIKPAIYSTALKDSYKETKNRVYGILLPRERKGAEKLSLLFKRVIIDELDVSNLFENNLSNIKAVDQDGEIKYYKSLMMMPLWELLSKDLNEKEKVILTKIIGYSIDDLYDNVDNKVVSGKINTTCTNFLDLSRNDSIILVAKTRSEEEYLSRAVEVASGRINDLYLSSATNNKV